MNGEAVNAIAALAPVQKFEVAAADGVMHEYTTKSVHEVKPAPPALLDKVDVNTLEGFGTLVTEKIDGLDPKKYFIHIVDEHTIGLVATDTDEHGRRQVLIKAQPVKFDGFEFGKWMNQESFIIAVAARFCDAEDKDYVLQIASSLTAEALSVSEDNGFTQKATVKAGMKTAEHVTLKGKVNLAPFRTFPEVGQPVSSFVFRAKQSEQGPLLMLIEADGGKWKVDAIKEVRRYVASLGLEPAIVA